MIKVLIIIVSILLTNYKGQDKDVEIRNIKVKEVNLKNITFLGVNKTDSIYTVYNRCDEGYPSIHFKQNEFYFYDPQEGANYIIKDIKNGNNRYVINTTGYYFIEGENIIKQNDTWFLEKKDDLLWTFQNKKWKKKIILSDSINLNKKKIAYKNRR
ncbi:hypothetical protein EG348_10605 [Chryseobacterium sp. G0201]|nr:hypothetical protein EG348_10605 [Chryseobacterium sp. G0201]